MAESTDKAKNSLANLKLWEPGQSGNPAGLPKGTIQTKTIVGALENLLDTFVDADKFLSPEIAKRMQQLFPNVGTNRIRDLLAARMVAIGLLGDNKTAMRAIKEIADRVEGTTTKNVNIQTGQQYAVFEMMIDTPPEEPGTEEGDFIDVTPTEDVPDGEEEITLTPD